MRYWLPVAIAALVVLSGCGGEPPAEVVNLSLFTWTRPGELAINQQLREEFEAEHPGVRVEIINEPGDRAMDKLQTMIAAGNPPDVMSIHGAYFVPLAANGALLDLDPLIAEDADFDLEDFYPELVDLCRYDGGLYSLPRYTSAMKR